MQAKSRTKARSALFHRSFFTYKSERSIITLVVGIFAAIAHILLIMLAFSLSPVPREEPTPPEANEEIIPVIVTETPTSTPPRAIGSPVRLKIPGIDVHAVINDVGLTSDGEMGVPELPQDTAWYMLGPKPGEIGSAVIAGHVDWLHGEKGVFENLQKIKEGDEIAVEDDQGNTTTFIVRNTRIFEREEDATDVFHSYDGKPHLNLVTCAGDWEKAASSYSERLVVFADKAEE